MEVAEVKVSYSNKIKAEDRVTVNNGKEAYEVFKKVFPTDLIDYQEVFYILLLNRANQVLGHRMVSMGGVSKTAVDPKIIFSVALLAHATSVILAHNHPSSTLRPSHADIELTKNLIEGGKLLEIVVADHVILTSEGYYSMSEKGII